LKAIQCKENIGHSVIWLLVGMGASIIILYEDLKISR